jgi:hypothetical protein
LKTFDKSRGQWDKYSAVEVGIDRSKTRSEGKEFEDEQKVEM